jgi:uncharacterized membrane protein YqaE (UPF0057 family)
MKKLIPIAIISMMTFNANAAFVVKQQAVQATEQVSNTATNVSSNTLTNSNEATSIEATQSSQITKSLKGGDAAIPKILYILLALLGLGYLGMLINDGFDFTGDYDWLISLLLYMLLFLPGLIYTLVKMKKYYGGGK